jgi:hypothetical protein
VAASSSLISVDHQQAIATSDTLADTGYAAVAAAYRFAIARAGADAAREAEALPVGDVLVGALEAVAHLCARLGVSAPSVFAAALSAHEQSAESPSNQVQTTMFWSDVQAPAITPDAHAHTVLTLLRDRPGGVTSGELRDLMVQNPSNVVMNLIRAGHPIRRIPVNGGQTKRRQALYVLDRREG